MTDQFLFMGSLVMVFVIWLTLKFQTRGYQEEVEVTRPFRIAMYAVGGYFVLAGFLVDFLDLVFPPWVTPVPITNTENWIWAKLIATNFTFTLGLMFLAMGWLEEDQHRLADGDPLHVPLQCPQQLHQFLPDRGARTQGRPWLAGCP